jgi:hypothetical protein
VQDLLEEDKIGLCRLVLFQIEYSIKEFKDIADSDVTKYNVHRMARKEGN